MTETAIARSALYSARPTLRLGGVDNVRASNLLMAMRMEECEGGMSSLELRFSNLAPTTDGGAELAFASDSDLKLGALIGVYSGDTVAPVEIFSGKISAIELEYKIGSGPELSVLAEDALGGARQARRSKLYSDQTPADVVRAVAGELGLTPVITALDAPSMTWAQINESDLSFLRRLLMRFDADLQIVGEELHVSPRADVARGAIDLVMFSQLAKVRVIADLNEQVSKVSAGGWNARDGAAVNGSASSVTHAGPGAGRDGKSWLVEALAERAEHVGHIAVASNDEAQAVAEAAFDVRARRFVRAEGTAEGNASLRVGSRVNLSAISPQFDNSYYVTRACHLFDLQQGYRTEFSAECAYLGGA